MDDTLPSQETAPTRRLLPAFLVFALAAATIALGVTGALFTDSDAIGNNSFATGTVALGTTAASLPFAVSDMAPGDTDGSYDVEVSNDGSLEYRYSITSTSNEDTLAGQLDMWVWLESAEDDTGTLGLASDNSTCDAEAGSAAIGSYLYEQGVLGSTGTTNVVGDPAQGEQAGDRVLGAGASEVLCVFVELPSTSDNTYEGLTTATDFAFEAEQTANNP